MTPTFGLGQYLQHYFKKCNGFLCDLFAIFRHLFFLQNSTYTLLYTLKKSKILSLFKKIKYLIIIILYSCVAANTCADSCSVEVLSEAAVL